MRRISNSEFWSYKRCRRRWWLSQYRRLHRKPATAQLGLPATVGSAVHAGLQFYYTPETPFDQEAAFHATYAYLDQLEEEHSVEQLDTINKARSLSQRMLEGYFEWLAETGVDAGLTVESAETVVGVEISGVILSGKMDTRLINDHTGGRITMDHKTVDGFTEMKRDIAMNEQLLTYTLIDHMTKDASERVDGGSLNMLKRVKRTAAAKPPFYDRATVNHSVDRLRAHYHRVVGQIEEIIRTEQRLAAGENPLRVVPPTPDKSCAWQCEFYRVCPLIDASPEAAEQRIANEFEEHDPYERYEDVNVQPAAQMTEESK